MEKPDLVKILTPFVSQKDVMEIVSEAWGDRTQRSLKWRAF
jgi:hypothetical protein